MRNNMTSDQRQPFIDDNIEPCAQELVQKLLLGRNNASGARPTARDCCSRQRVRSGGIR